MSATASASPWLDKKGARDLAWLAVAFIVLLSVHFAPPWGDLSAQGKSIIGVFFWFLIVAISGSANRITLGLTTPLLIVVFCGAKPAVAFQAFASDTFFLIIGTFVFAAVMTVTPLGARIALTLTSLFRSSKISRIFSGLTLGDLAINTFLPSVAETGLLLPIVTSFQGLTKGHEDDPEVKRINESMMLLICGVIPLLTGLLLLTAHLPNMLLAGYLEGEGFKLTFLDWFVMNAPLWLLLPAAIFIFVKIYKLKDVELPDADTVIPRMKEELGPITKSETWSLFCVSVCLFLWLTQGTLHNIQSGMVSLILVFLLFLPFGQLKFQDVMPAVLWDTWILLGGAISLGTCMSSFGAVDWLVNIVLSPVTGGLIGLPAIAILFIVVFALHIPRAGIVSAGAMGAMFVPVVISLSSTLGFNVVPFTLIVINCLSYAFFLPMSTTAYFIAWGASGVSMKKAVGIGSLISFVCNVWCIVLLYLWLPIVGYPLM